MLLAGTTLAACNDGDGGGASDGAFRAQTPENNLSVEMVDHAYNVTGTLTSGAVTITTTNVGREWHMATFARLQPGKSVSDLAAFLDAQEAGVPEDESPESGIDSIIGAGLGAPGQILQPGHRQSLTVGAVEPGNYVMLCYLPVEGLGTPHFTKGMVAGFEVGAGPAAAPPTKADFDVTLGDSADPTGLPTELDPGVHTFKLTSTGTAGKDFTVSQLAAGQTTGSFAIYFADEFNRPGGPPIGTAARAPGQVLGSSFEIGAGETVWLTIDLPPGPTYFDSATNVDGGDAVHRIVIATVG